MCGIIGYKGEEDAGEIVHRGLKKLEYRGYDSAGIATVGNPSLKIEKGEGQIEEAIEKSPDGKTGIGHTRWATHGGVDDTNAHPHLDHEGRVALVHNGIIKNHEEIRKQLGVEKTSDTDSEVVAHLLSQNLKIHENVEKAVEKTEERLEGSYAVLATLDSGELVAMKKDSPLVFAENDGEIFFGSDTTPFLDQVEEATFLEDGDYMVVDEEIRIFNSGKKVEREPREVDWNAEDASKKGYDHFMQKEIHEQPTTMKRAALQDRKKLEQAAEMIRKAESVYITGCGTSSYASKMGARYFRSKGIEVNVEQSHELEYRKHEIGDEDLVIAVSQSGETADLLSLTEKVDAYVLSIVNVQGSTLDREADLSLNLNAGPEIGVASTKAFTSQLVVLKLLSYVMDGDIREGRKSLVETAEKVEKVLEDNQENVEELSEFIAERDDVYFIGRNKGSVLADEAALKLKELSYIHSESFPGGEFKHGTLALVEEGVPVVGMVTERGSEELISNVIEAKSRGAEIILSGVEGLESADYSINIPEDENSEILHIIPFQLLAYSTSVEKGNNPDKPRNLAKSVTVK
ncbi:MAG: glutamine--fructose-6-phosphate transaminase (isomerizing) [Candidatus Paceibacteria bacterium]